MDIVYHYPPELFQLLVDTISLLCPRKRDVLVFFRGAGVNLKYIKDLWERVETDIQNINKYEITRTVLTRLNEKGEVTLPERREVLRRVVEFEDFSTCWPDDQLKAKGLVAQIRHVVNVKDSFTRMKQEREKEREERRAEYRAKLHEQQQRQDELVRIKNELSRLFFLEKKDAAKRGKALEAVLNRLFKCYDILVKESFHLVGEEGEGIVEQIDGIIKLDGELYLVEMKWQAGPVGKPEISEHLVRVFTRDCARGIFISASDYTGPAKHTCKEALQKSVFILCKLEELVRLLEEEGDLKDFLREKIDAAIGDKEPLYEPLNRS